MNISSRSISLLYILPTLAFCLLFSRCTDSSRLVYKTEQPVEVFLDLRDLRNSFEVKEPSALANPGNIYVYQQYLFVNEMYDGLHVINNSDPSNPVYLKYLQIPGNTDVVIKNNFLYANSGPDMLVIDISDINNIKLVNRLENALFESRKLVNGKYMIGIRDEEVTVSQYRSRGWDFFFGVYEDKVFVTSHMQNSGIGGSMARFALAGDFLYFVTDGTLLPIDILNPQSPSVKTGVSLGRGNIQTLINYKQYLLAGTTTGVFIIDQATNPAVPKVLSSVEHFTACDPVVVQDDIAFSTTSFGSRCGGGFNELMVINIKNAENPVVMQTYQFSNTPLGLSIHGDDLLLCLGNGGFSWFKTTNLMNITASKIAEEPNIHARDIIRIDDHLIITGNDGIFQYRLNGNSITRIGTLFSK